MAAWWHRRLQMPTVEERLAYLEGRGEDVRDDIRDIRDDIRGLRGWRGEMNDLRGEIRGDMGSLRGQFREMREEQNRRFDAIDAKCRWLLGLELATLVMMAGVLFAAYVR